MKPYLGHPTIAHYAERRFSVQRSETFEMLRVAEIVDERPACRDAFEQGRLSWSALKAITRVASAETEEAWLSFAAEHTFTELENEVAVCATCHALLHAGLLHVSGDPFSRLTWTPRSSRLAMDTPAGDDAPALAAIPATRPESAIADSGVQAPATRPTTAPTAAPARAGTDLETLSGALVRLGLAKKVAITRLEQAWLALTSRGETTG